NNHLMYVIALLMISLIQILFIRFSLLYFSFVIDFTDKASPFTALLTCLDREPTVMILVLIQSAHSITSLNQCYRQINGIRENTTTNERMNGRRYLYLQQGGRFVNPFDQGLSSNLREFFFNEKDCHKTKRRVYEVYVEAEVDKQIQGMDKRITLMGRLESHDRIMTRSTCNRSEGVNYRDLVIRNIPQTKSLVSKDSKFGASSDSSE
ncbi:hypothetical protein PROFUN_13346, partial [Planoprotostelium fungivorum]